MHFFSFFSSLYSPVISTENGNLLISSPGNLMFEAGDGGQVLFMSSDGEPLKVAEKGEKVRFMG